MGSKWGMETLVSRYIPATLTARYQLHCYNFSINWGETGVTLLIHATIFVFHISYLIPSLVFLLVSPFLPIDSALLLLPTKMSAWRNSSNIHNSILRSAETGQYGVIAAIAYNIEQILGLVQAACVAPITTHHPIFPMGC